MRTAKILRRRTKDHCRSNQTTLQDFPLGSNRLECLAAASGEEQSFLCANGDPLWLRGMHRQGERFRGALAFAWFPRRVVVAGVVEAGAEHTGVGSHVVDIDDTGVIAGCQDVKVRFTGHAQLFPSTSLIGAFHQAEGTDHRRVRGGMTACVKSVPGRGKAHVIMFRARRILPSPVLIQHQTKMRRYVQDFSVR